MFTQSFIITQKQRETQWMQHQAKGTGLEDFDEDDVIMNSNKRKLTSSESLNEDDINAKKNLSRLRLELKDLLNASIYSSSYFNNNTVGGFSQSKVESKNSGLQTSSGISQGMSDINNGGYVKSRRSGRKEIDRYQVNNRPKFIVVAK